MELHNSIALLLFASLCHTLSVVRTLTAAFLVALLIMFTTIQHLHCLQHASYVECVVEQLLQRVIKISAYIGCLPNVDIQFELLFCYLVDPASSDMLVLKIKPCMCKYKWNSSETANGSLYQL